MHMLISICLYIGPTALTMLNFWQMIWDQKCSVLVMLTKVEEKGKVGQCFTKCNYSATYNLQAFLIASYHHGIHIHTSLVENTRHI